MELYKVYFTNISKLTHLTSVIPIEITSKEVNLNAINKNGFQHANINWFIFDIDYVGDNLHNVQEFIDAINDWCLKLKLKEFLEY